MADADGNAATVISMFVCMRAYVFLSFILHMFAGIEFLFYSQIATFNEQTTMIHKKGRYSTYMKFPEQTNVRTES